MVGYWIALKLHHFRTEDGKQYRLFTHTEVQGERGGGGLQVVLQEVKLTKNKALFLYYKLYCPCSSVHFTVRFVLPPIQNTVVQCIELQGNRCGPGRRHLNIRGL